MSLTTGTIELNADAHNADAFIEYKPFYLPIKPGGRIWRLPSMNYKDYLSFIPADCS